MRIVTDKKETQTDRHNFSQSDIFYKRQVFIAVEARLIRQAPI